MSSDEKSGSDSERSRSEDSEEDSKSSKSKANNSEEEEESQANKSNSESENEDGDGENKSNKKFDASKLVLSNEIKIDVTSKNLTSDIFMTGVENKKSSLKIINEINSNLDELFDDLSKTMKSFNHTRRESNYENENENENFSPKNNKNNKPSYSPVNKHYFTNEEDDMEEINEPYRHESTKRRQESYNKRMYTDKGISARGSQIKVMHTDKGTSTYDIKTKSFGNNPSHVSLNKNEIKSSKHNVQPNSSTTKYNATNPYANNLNSANKTNHIRSIEDLYNHKRSEPIIYNTARQNPINYANKKKFQNESDAYNSGRY